MDTHLIFDVVSSVVTVAWVVIGLLIKTNLMDIRLNQERLRNEFNEKHAENTQTIAVHQGEDTKQFEAIGRTLQRIDTKLENMSNRR